MNVGYIGPSSQEAGGRWKYSPMFSAVAQTLKGKLTVTTVLMVLSTGQSTEVLRC